MSNKKKHLSCFGLFNIIADVVIIVNCIFVNPIGFSDDFNVFITLFAVVSLGILFGRCIEIGIHNMDADED
mgnify:CR=1 FL=1